MCHPGVERGRCHEADTESDTVTGSHQTQEVETGDNAETAETPTTVTMWTMGHLQPHLHCARVIVLGIGTCCCLLEFPLVRLPSVTPRHTIT